MGLRAKANFDVSFNGKVILDQDMTVESVGVRNSDTLILTDQKLLGGS